MIFEMAERPAEGLWNPSIAFPQQNQVKRQSHIVDGFEGGKKFFRVFIESPAVVPDVDRGPVLVSRRKRCSGDSAVKIAARVSNTAFGTNAVYDPGGYLFRHHFEKVRQGVEKGPEVGL